MTHEELDAIRKRAEAATPGKWTIAGRPPCVVDRPLGDDKKVIVNGMDSNVEGQRDNWNDLYFIAHARQDVPALLAEVERLMKALEYAADLTELYPKESMAGAAYLTAKEALIWR